MRKSILIAAGVFSVGALTIVACSDTGKKVVLIDSGNSHDSNNGGDIDAPPSGACLLSSSLGTVTPSMQQGSFSAGSGSGSAATQDVYDLQAVLNADPTPDVLDITLFKGYGAFTTDFGPFPKTVQITGDEAQYAVCGACVLAYTDIDAQGMPAGDPYIATGGTLVLNSVTPMITGTLSNITFTHVTIDQSTLMSTPTADGCQSSLASLAFTATATAAFDGKTVLHIKIPHVRH